MRRSIGAFDDAAELDKAVVRVLRERTPGSLMPRVKLLSALNLAFADDLALSRSLTRLAKQGLVAHRRGVGGSGWYFAHKTQLRRERKES